MSDRVRAIAILKEARRILADRLTARILDAGDEIINDAEGGSYTSELETVFDEIGTRLVHVNGLLSNLPLEESPQPAVTAEANPLPSQSADGDDDSKEGQAREPASFQLFVQQVTDHELEAAGRSLAELFDVDVQRACRCAEKFHSQLTSQPDFLEKAMKLRTVLQTGGVNDSLMLLWECFGLQGTESIGVLQTLKIRLRQ